MQGLSHKQFGELRDLYAQVYAPRSILEGFINEDFNLTDEEIEEQVEEVFLECIEEGYDIDDIERIICEAIDTELHMLSERVDPKETQRRRTQAKDRLETSRAMKSAAAKSSASDSSDKKASTLSRVKGAAKRVASGLKKGAKAAGKAAQGGIGLAARAVGTAQRAGSAVKSAAKSGYERGRHGASGSSSGSSSSSSSSSGSSSSGSSSSGSSDSGSNSSDSGSSSYAPARKKRKDGLLKRGLKKLVRGAGKAVSTAAGAVKAGADYVTDRARKEELEATGLFSEKEIEAIMEAEMIDENRRAARAAGGYRDDSKKQPDPSKDGFTGVGNMSIDAIRKMSARIEKEKTKKEEVEAVDEGLTGERYKAALKKGKQYSRRVSADPAKRATRGGRGGESDFGAGDRGAGNKASRRAGTYED